MKDRIAKDRNETVLNIRMADSLKKQIEKEAQNTGLKPSQIARQALIEKFAVKEN